MNIDPHKLNRLFEKESAFTILSWAWETFPESIFATSSFQSQSIPLLHIISQTAPALPILFLDTGYHFPETLTFLEQVRNEFNLNVKSIRPKNDGKYGSYLKGELYRTDPDICCFNNKVKPLQEEKQNFRAWIAGIRKDQTSSRKRTPVVSLDDDGLYKICPMANWSRRDIWDYIYQYKLPTHPLLDQGYLSIGCAPCTRPISFGDDERLGRWPDQEKNECGLHFTNSNFGEEVKND